MPRTLLFIGDDRDVMADLALLPGRAVRCTTISEARHFLLRDEEARGVDFLIAYALNIAVQYLGTGAGRDVPLLAWGAPLVLLRGEHGASMRRAADRLATRATGPARVVSLPDELGWLDRELAGKNKAAR